MLSNAPAADDTDKSASFLCAFCSMELYSLSIGQREAHYDLHLNDDATEQHEGPIKFTTLWSSSLTSSSGSRSVPIDIECIPESSTSLKALPINSSPNRPPKKFRWGKQSDTFWYAGLDTPPPRNYVPGTYSSLATRYD